MSFHAPYEFKVSGREVVVQHSHNGHLRVSPGNEGYADGNGGNGQYARWRVILEGGQYCRLQSVKTGKYLRIWRGGKEIDVMGGTGPFTKFRIHYHNRPNGVKLESDRFPGRYIAVHANKTMKIGSGGPHCNLWVKREGGHQQQHHHHQHVSPVRVVQQPQVTVVTQPSVGQASGSFGLPYQFKQNNTVVVRSNYGKHLRVNPQNNYEADGNGGQGQYAQWRVILDGGGVIKLQNTHTNKYLRIEASNAVNVGGTGGEWTRFRTHVYSHPHGVKLESCRLPGKYVAIRPNGVVTIGNGGIHTQLTFWRHGQPNVVHQPQVVQPTVVYTQPMPQQPTVIVQNPSFQAQQQQQAIQQQMAAQQQAVQQQMALQQQQMQQQMEAMKLQNEASLNAQRQAMELQKQQMEAQMAAQQAQLEREKQMLAQQQANLSQTSLSPHAMSPHAEGLSNTFPPPVNPYYGGSGTNIVVDDAPPSYPVLVQQQQSGQQQQYAEPPEDNKQVEEDVVPSKGQDAANEVLEWLTKLKMQRYYQTFIENGYDQMETIGEISKEDLKEMGVALGHIKIITGSCVNAPFANKRVRLKSVSHNTYIHEYGAPKAANGGKRCVLQHNDKKDNPGTVWVFEVVEDQVFRLRHETSGTWMRIKKDNANGTDTRSPAGGFSDLVLERHEKDKGVYYIKELKQEFYVRCEKPRSIGRNLVSFVGEKMPDCRMKIELVR